jgi:hypothetical protein
MVGSCMYVRQRMRISFGWLVHAQSHEERLDE